MSWSDQDKRFDDLSASELATDQANPGSGGFLEQALWTRFGEAATAEEFASAWLELQCEMIDGVTSAVVVLKRGDGFVPIASWPPHLQLQPSITSVTELAIEERRGVVRASNDEGVDALALRLGGSRIPLARLGKLQVRCDLVDDVGVAPLVCIRRRWKRWCRCWCRNDREGKSSSSK